SCLHRVHRNGSSTYAPQMLGAALIHPDVRAVIPLMPEPLVRHEGTAKNDGERNAARRFVATLRQDHRHLTCIMTGDRLRANPPPSDTPHTYGLPYIGGSKEGYHASLCQQVQAAEHAGRGPTYERHDRAAGLVHRFRFVHDVPRKASHLDVRGNVIEYWERGQETGQHFSWVTALRGHSRKVFHLMRGGRARWKSDNETFQTLKNQGYHCEPPAGHGEQHVSVMFAMRMRLAFLVEQAQQRCCALFQAVWAKMGSKRLWWERMRALFYTYHLAALRELFEALFDGFEKFRPL